MAGGIVDIVFASLDIFATLIILLAMIEYNSQVGIDVTYLTV